MLPVNRAFFNAMLAAMGEIIPSTIEECRKIDDTTITVYATSVVEQVQECSPPTKDTPLAATTEVLKWHRADGDPNTILLIDNACAAKYPNQENCNIAGCPIGLYCTSRLKRE